MFSEDVTFAPNQEALALTIRGDKDLPISQTITWGGYNPTTFVATWTLNSPLARRRCGHIPCAAVGQ
jgi:hypothetical protein